MTLSITDLPRDLVTEILSRVSKNSLRAVRCTCKNLNHVSKEAIGEAKATKEREVLVVTVMDSKVNLMSVDLQEDQSSTNFLGELINRKGGSVQIKVSEIFHCDGLLLCITQDIKPRLVVWNPYLGQTRWIKPSLPKKKRWIKPRTKYRLFALGYEKNHLSLNHKILRFELEVVRDCNVYDFQIYNFDSDSWKYVDGVYDIQFCNLGVSLKGNTYWYGKYVYDRHFSFLICFDFTTERFGPPLDLPFESRMGDIVTLSSVKQEQLAVLFQRWDALRIEIWITTKTETGEVLWNNLFLAVNMSPQAPTQFQHDAGSVFVDEKNKVVVILGKDAFHLTRNVAYIVGNDGYFKQVDLGESNTVGFPPVCSYVPSCTQIKQPTRPIQQNKSSIIASLRERITGLSCFGH